jgi:hypothetical protein
MILLVDSNVMMLILNKVRPERTIVNTARYVNSIMTNVLIYD